MQQATPACHFAYAAKGHPGSGLPHVKGPRSVAFQTMRYSEKLLLASGIAVVTADLSGMMGAAGAKGYHIVSDR